jgi:hypothetical protein
LEKTDGTDEVEVKADGWSGKRDKMSQTNGQNGRDGCENRRTDNPPVPKAGKNPKALNSPAAERVYGAHGGFRKLKAFQVAELCYDYTCLFAANEIGVSKRRGVRPSESLFCEFFAPLCDGISCYDNPILKPDGF